MSRHLLILAALGLAFGSPEAARAQRGIPRFPLGTSPLALAGPARPGVYLADEGRRAALFGTETGAFEAWVWPVKLVRDLDLAFKIPEYDEPIAAATVARRVEARPEGATIVYSHSTFTVRQHVFVPLDEPGALMLLEVETVRPLEVQVRMHADFDLAWPGSFGGGYITWVGGEKRFLLSQGGVRLYNAYIGSPFAAGGTSHPAHDAPTVPSQFTLRFDTARVTTDFIPIVIAGGAMTRDSATAAYGRLLANAERYWREKVEHYARVRETQLRMRTPVPTLDRALEWAKVNLDQQLVCNPDLGCGLVAGFGRAGPGNYRPGFGWFFGGDAAINSLAMDGLGQLALVKQGLEFLAKYQRADGKITHEISQAAGRLPWFTDYPYTFFHGDTTPFFILACWEYWRASGDDAFLRALWPQLVKAFRWSASTDGDGDGLMENPLAGAGAIEVGGLGENLLTDIYLASIWTVSLEGVRAMAAALRDSRVQQEASRLFERARARLEGAYWLEGAGIYAFALLGGGEGEGTEREREGGQVRTNDALTMWPATAMAFGLLDPVRSGRMLAELGSSRITADWGTRMLAWDHPLYESQHYNNGTVWGFVTGFVALAHYRYHRAWAGYDLIRDVARTSFDFARGRNPELMSGAFYKPLDTAVPQQFFATSMLVSPLVRGLLGWQPDAPAGKATLAPHLPAEWDAFSASNLAVGGSKLSVEVSKVPGAYRLRVRREAGTGPLALRVAPALPLGATVEAATVGGTAVPFTVETSPCDVHAVVEVVLDEEALVEVRHGGGLEVVTPAERLAAGDASGSLRVLDVRQEGDAHVLEVEARAGRAYDLDVRPGAGTSVTAVSGATRVASPEGMVRLRVVFGGEGAGWARRQLRIGTQVRGGP
jgi:glycogen debranching enzyme